MDKLDILISHTVFERMALLKRLYLISLISLVLAVVLVIFGLEKWMKNGSVEFLILCFINVPSKNKIIIGTSYRTLLSRLPVVIS